MKNSSVIARTFLLGASVLSIPASLSAALVTGVTATTNMGTGFGTSLANTVNGVGLTGDVPSLTSPHDSTLPANSWVSAPAILTGNVDFTFPSAQPIGGFSFWNQNAGGPGTLGSTGIQGVNISYSLDGTTFLPLPGAPTTFAKVTGVGPAAPQTFTFAPVIASRVRFGITSNYGDRDNGGQTGFAEAQFNTTPVPEPATVGFGLALVGAIASSRRRQAVLAA
jgi:hypothetical protein